MEIVTLKDIAIIGSGQGAPQGSSSYCNDGIPFIKAGSLESLLQTNNEYISCLKVNPEIAKQHKLKLYPKDTIVFAKSGMSAMKGRVYRLTSPSYVVNHLATIEPSEKIIPQYLKYYFQNFSPASLIKDRAYPSIRLSDISIIKIPLPSLEEQKRIVKELDQADKLRQKRKQSVALLDEYLKSVFLEMFGDPVVNEKRWEVKKLGDICIKITDGTHQSPKFQNIGIPFIFISNIINNRIDLNTKKYISEETYSELTKSTPIENGDILYTTVGSYGNPAIVETDKKFCFQRHIAHIKPNIKKTNIIFLYGMLKSDFIKKQADQKVRGVAQKTLNLKDLKGFKVFLPPMEVQNQFAEIVQKTEQLKQSMLSQSEELDTNFNALMQGAFR